MKLTQLYLVLLVWVMVLFAKTQCNQPLSAKRQSIALVKKSSKLSQKALVDMALENFKKVIAEETGHFHKLCCKFKQDETTKGIQKVTRAYFTDYHKKASCLIDNPTEQLEGKMKKVAEVVITKLDPNHLVVTTWDADKHSSVKYIPLKEDLFSVA